MPQAANVIELHFTFKGLFMDYQYQAVLYFLSLYHSSLVIIVVKYCQVKVIIGVLQDGNPLGVPSDSVQLRYGCGSTLWLMVDFAIVNRVYKPTCISKAPS